MLKHRQLKREHSHLLQKSSQNINTWYQKKTSQELFIKDEAENLYDIIRFQQNEEAQELIDYLLTPNPLDKKIDHFYRDKLKNIKLPDLQVLFEAKFLKAKELDVWVSMEVPEPITVYPIYPLDWVLVKTLPNVDYRIGLHAGYLTQIIEIFAPGY